MATEFKHIVRLIDRDVDGSKTIVDAISDVKGIGLRLAEIIARKLGIPYTMRVGFLPSEKIAEIEKTIKSLSNGDMPDWLLNRRKDLETGEDKHLISSDIDLAVKADIEREKMLWSWRGYRHAYGLKVRGQKTRTTGRTGKTIGVSKKGAKKTK
ncbi:MAG: 30S ribosomal protein S13 [Candidatus Bathyarchaeia archaeon]|nr:30S ribosomal protein S13 [Candidatus Bathyarchaeota archaeon]